MHRLKVGSDAEPSLSMSLHTPVSAAVAMLGQFALVVHAAPLIEQVPATVGQLALVVQDVPVWIELDL